MKLKICGMKQPENIQAVATLEPDFMGFIFYEKSARNFEGTIPTIHKNIKKVGVFVNNEAETISDLASKHQLQVIQLHGQETPEYFQQLREILSPDIELIKVFSVGNDFDFDVLKPFEKVCDYFLFDTKGKLPGGNGTTFNWQILDQYPSTKPYFLSGGIALEDLDLVANIKIKPFALDINSKFELAPGLKNIELLERFVRNLNQKKLNNHEL